MMACVDVIAYLTIGTQQDIQAAIDTFVINNDP